MLLGVMLGWLSEKRYEVGEPLFQRELTPEEFRAAMPPPTPEPKRRMFMPDPPICTECKTHEGDISAVISGEYYPNICTDCRTRLNAGQSVSSGHARWARDIDLQDNEANIQQPYNADGTVNGRFAKLYPTQAKALFTDEQIRKAQ